MSWIKRNLLFVIGGVVALALLGLAGFYLFTEWTVNNKNSTDLESAYTELKRITDLPINPGNDKVDNISLAKDYQATVRAKITNTAAFFNPIPTIPPGGNVTSEAFAAALRRTVDELTRNAAASSVTLPPKYDFSFEAQRPLVKFAGSLDPLAEELGEVKAICDVLFKAKINMLYGLRRPRVSDDDQKGPQTDYLETTSTTNDLSIITPYEVTFYGFSAELAGVLAGFASDNHGFIVTTLNVEPGTPDMNVADNANGMSPDANPAPINRYLRSPYGPGYGSAYGSQYAATQPGSGSQPGMAPGAMPLGKGGLPVVLDERQLKVTMGVAVVKLLPKK